MLLGCSPRDTLDWKLCRKYLTRNGRYGLQQQIAGLDISALDPQQVSVATNLAFGGTTGSKSRALAPAKLEAPVTVPYASPRRRRQASAFATTPRTRRKAAVIERQDVRLMEVKQVSRAAAALLRWVFDVVRWFDSIQAQKPTDID